MLFGLLLRYVFISGLDVNFQNILHTHSHIALLGWVNTALMALIGNYFVPTISKKHTISFFLVQVSVVGMLLFFPFQGYALTTIVFSSMFLIFCYFYLFQLIKEVKNSASKNLLSVWSLRAAALFFVLSSLGPWALAPINKMGLAGSNWYYLAIYFYLHFLYNGWFLFVLIALLFKHLESFSSIEKNVNAKRFFIYLFISCFPSYFMSVLWTQPSIVFYLISGIAAILQILALIYFFKFLASSKALILKSGLYTNLILRIVLILFVAKIILQFVSCFPFFAAIAYQNRMFIIAYLHMVLIGIVSFFILAFFLRSGLIVFGKMTRFYLYFLFIGFFFSEALLFSQASLVSFFNYSIGDYNQLLFAVSSLMAIGVLLLFIDQIRFALQKHSTQGKT